MKQHKNMVSYGIHLIVYPFILLMILTLIPSNKITAQLSLKRNSIRSESAITVKNQKEQIKAIRKAMLSRKSALDLYYQGPINDLELDSEELMRKVFALDYATTSTDGDYLANIYSGYQVATSYYSDEASLVYQFKYNETKKQTDAVNRKVKLILKKMNLSEKSTGQKVKLIHDFIVNNTIYDITLTDYSAYNALIEKSSVCQGYALLTYKMLTEAGIETRIITGFGNGEPHAWNIVKVEDVWYNLDCTWDDPISNTGKQVLIYDYYLKNEEDFKNHKRDPEFKTKEFLKHHTIAENSYSKNK